VLQRRINRTFAWAFRLDLSEAEKRPEEYASLSAFFVRGLREGTRSWPTNPMAPGSPADGVLGPLGRLERGTALQAKGITYGVAELLGDSELPEFQSGLFLTIYLSPRHYHRVHTPCRVQLHTARVIPGRLLPVHPAATRLQKGLLTGNERLVTLMESNRVSLAVVAIGACNVGSISADFDPDWETVSGRGVTNRAGGRVVTRSYIPARMLNPGDPLASFYLGSTVVVLIGEGGGGRAELHSGLQVGREVRVGAPILAGLLGD
jgi:phosphatidylserine decarboxylase